jgi:hypothetical protein
MRAKWCSTFRLHVEQGCQNHLTLCMGDANVAVCKLLLSDGLRQATRQRWATLSADTRHGDSLSQDTLVTMAVFGCVGVLVMWNAD